MCNTLSQHPVGSLYALFLALLPPSRTCVCVLTRLLFCLFHNNHSPPVILATPPAHCLRSDYFDLSVSKWNGITTNQPLKPIQHLVAVDVLAGSGRADATLSIRDPSLILGPLPFIHS